MQTTRPDDAQKEPIALILSGGGARASYQVGALKAIAELLPQTSPLPFDIICGTSAGALNASSLAVHACHFRRGTKALEKLWGSIKSEQIYETHWSHLLTFFLRYTVAAIFAGQPKKPIAMLNNAPLNTLLKQSINFKKLDRSIKNGHLDVLSISASNYETGESVTFFQGRPELKPWRERRRVGRAVKLKVKHLMASTAIPFVFPAENIDGDYYGDGAIRQLSPLSPALHFGAKKILVIGVSDRRAIKRDNNNKASRPPSLAKTIGHVLNSAFIDNFEGDIERLEKINRTLKHIPPELKQQYAEILPYKEVEALTILPSLSLSAIAKKHRDALPKTLKLFLRGSGATRSSGASTLSFLLFESAYTKELISLGYHDAMQQKDKIHQFFTP